MPNARPAPPRDTTVRPLDYKALVSAVNAGDWHWVDVPEAPFPVAMRLALSPDGRAVCVGLMAGSFVRFANQPAGKVRAAPAEVTATGLRRIPLGQLLDDLSRGTFGRDVLGLPEMQRPTRLGPRGIPVERLAKVAGLYRRGLVERPSAPVRWVSEQILNPNGKPTSEVTVRRWLQRCRDLRLLGPSIPGKAGEQPLPPRRRRPG
jgi:hypothetical protein